MSVLEHRLESTGIWLTNKIALTEVSEL